MAEQTEERRVAGAKMLTLADPQLKQAESFHRGQGL